MGLNKITSKSVAVIAAKILNMKQPTILTNELWDEIKTLAGSALTQAPNDAKTLFPTSVYKKDALLKKYPLQKKDRN